MSITAEELNITPCEPYAKNTQHQILAFPKSENIFHTAYISRTFLNKLSVKERNPSEKARPSVFNKSLNSILIFLITSEKIPQKQHSVLSLTGSNAKCYIQTDGRKKKIVRHRRVNCSSRGKVHTSIELNLEKKVLFMRTHNPLPKCDT